MVMLAVLTGLCGCEYLGMGKDEQDSGISVKQGPVTGQQPMTIQQAAADMYSTPGLSADYADMAMGQTGGSVQIFKLDDSAPAPAVQPSSTILPLVEPAPVAMSVADSQGIPFSGDPNVMVFPLEPLPSGGSNSGATLTQPSSSMAASAPASSQWSETGGQESFGKLYFRHGSDRLNDLDRAFISKVAAAAGNSRIVRIEGHASKRTGINGVQESHIVNLKMSMKRAFAVAQELIRKGVPAENIRTMALGDVQPPRQNGPPEKEESLERRVEIYTQ